jgi:hypothetical protein
MPPLARLIQGGRGGEVRLKLYLFLTMMATTAPYDIRNPPTPATLARTLDLPTDTGPRRITSNLRWLESHGFISTTKRSGLTPAIQLLDLDIPGNHPLTNPRSHGPWLTIPIGFWSYGWLLHLSPVGIAVLFSLSELLGGYKTPRYMLRDRHESYGLSHDTWTRGISELKENRLLEVDRNPQGSDYAHSRLRNSYWLINDLLEMPPVQAS